MRRIILTGLAALGLVALLVWAFRPQPEPVETALVAPRDIAVVIEAEGVEKAQKMLNPSFNTVFEVFRTIREAEADHVRGDCTVLLRDFWQYHPPVCPGRNTRTRSVDEYDRRAFTHIVIIGANASGDH